MGQRMAATMVRKFYDLLWFHIFDCRMRMISELGFDYVCASSPAQVCDGGADSLGALSERYALPIDNVHLSGSNTNDMWIPGISGDAVLKRYCDEMAQMTERGVCLGVAHVTWGLNKPPLTELGLTRFRRLMDCAEKHGFTVAFENSVSPAHLRAVLQHTSSPFARFCFDTGHWYAFAPGDDFTWQLANVLSVTHIQDNDGSGDQHRIPFDGRVPFEKLADVLAATQYLTFEVASRNQNPTLYGQCDYAEFLGRIMRAGRRVAALVDGNDGGDD